MIYVGNILARDEYNSMIIVPWCFVVELLIPGRNPPACIQRISILVAMPSHIQPTWQRRAESE